VHIDRLKGERCPSKEKNGTLQHPRKTFRNTLYLTPLEKDCTSDKKGATVSPARKERRSLLMGVRGEKTPLSVEGSCSYFGGKEPAVASHKGGRFYSENLKSVLPSRISFLSRKGGGKSAAHF